MLTLSKMYRDPADLGSCSHGMFNPSGESPMATCDYCGASYRGGAMKEGPYRFCTGLCRDRGIKILQNLKGVLDEQMEASISRAHQGPCPLCNENANVDVHTSYRFRSALIYCSWQERSFVSCMECARKTQRDDLGFTVAAGWWSPPGILITPFAIIFQFLEMRRRPDPARPSDRFRKRMTLDIARHLVVSMSPDN